MNLSTNLSPSFKGIQSNTEAMTLTQQRKTDSLYNAIKLSDGYQKHENGDIDVYILPRKGSNSDIEVRYADLHSGNFVKLNPLNNSVSQKYKTPTVKMADKVVDTLDKIQDGKIKRPNVDKNKFFKGETDTFKLRPELYKKLNDNIEMYSEVEYEDGAKNRAYDSYLYVNTVLSVDKEF